MEAIFQSVTTTTEIDYIIVQSKHWLVINILQPENDIYEILSLDIIYPDLSSRNWTATRTEDGTSTGRRKYESIDGTKIYIPITASDIPSGENGSRYEVTNIKYLDGTEVVDANYQDGTPTWIVLYIGYKPIKNSGTDVIASYNETEKSIRVIGLVNEDNAPIKAIYIDDETEEYGLFVKSFNELEPFNKRSTYSLPETFITTSGFFRIKVVYDSGAGGEMVISGYASSTDGALQVRNESELRSIDRNYNGSIYISEDIQLTEEFIPFTSQYLAINGVSNYESWVATISYSGIVMLYTQAVSSEEMGLSLWDLNFQCTVIIENTNPNFLFEVRKTNVIGNFTLLGNTRFYDN